MIIKFKRSHTNIFGADAEKYRAKSMQFDEVWEKSIKIPWQKKYKRLQLISLRGKHKISVESDYKIQKIGVVTPFNAEAKLTQFDEVWAESIKTPYRVEKWLRNSRTSQLITNRFGAEAEKYRAKLIQFDDVWEDIRHNV